MVIDVQIKSVLYFVKLSVGSGFYYAHTDHKFIVFCSQSSLVRLSNLRLAVSHTFLYKKMMNLEIITFPKLKKMQRTNQTDWPVNYPLPKKHLF